MIDLDLLRCFLAIYRAGSVTRAAELLALSQPAASGRLKALELRIGKPLFRREGRGLQATREARALAKSIGSYIDGLEAIFDTTASGTTDIAGTVKLAGPVEFVSLFVAPLLAKLFEAGVRLDIRFGDADERIGLVATGEIDLAIATTGVSDKRVEYRQLHRETFVVVGAPLWRARLSTRSLPALMDTEDALPLLAYAHTLPIIRRYWSEVFRRPLERRAALILPDQRGLVAAAVAGAGVTVLPDYLCRTELGDGRLVLLHEPPSKPGNDILLAWRMGRQHARNIVVRDLLFKVMEGEP
jgi:DNA-binding transcriptional LysR family regulator